MKKKILFIVIPIVLAIIIVGIATIVVISSILNKNKSVGTTWGDTYYAYLKEAINENQNYNWYIHENSSTSDSYILLKNIVDKLKNNSDKSEKSSNVNIAEIEADYTIKKDEAEISQETTDGNKITIKKFDQIFVKPEIQTTMQIT